MEKIIRCTESAILTNPGQSPGNDISIIKTPIGKIQICIENEFITQIAFIDLDTKLQASTNNLLCEAAMQIEQYFTKKNFYFDLPLKLTGTALQQKVWLRLQKIPYGKTVTYGELARELNTSARAIGGACRKNPLLLAIPCHRVIAVDGLGGFSGKRSGHFLDIKQWLLENEKN